MWHFHWFCAKWVPPCRMEEHSGPGEPHGHICPMPTQSGRQRYHDLRLLLQDLGNCIKIWTVQYSTFGDTFVSIRCSPVKYYFYRASSTDMDEHRPSSCFAWGKEGPGAQVSGRPSECLHSISTRMHIPHAHYTCDK